MSEPTVTVREAEAHEALVLSLEALLSELRPLAARHPLAEVPPPLIALSEDLLFEVRRSFWSPERAAFVWRLGRDETRPIARLRPRLARLADADRAATDKMRAKLRRHIEARIEEAYERGLAK